MTAGLLTSKMTKETDTAVYNDSSIVIEAEEA